MTPPPIEPPAGPARWGPADRSGLTPIDGGVTAPAGFRAGGVTAGLKPSGASDLAVVLADAPATAAAVTTTNRVKAAPCVVTERHVADGRAQAVILNAGSANACTGAEGLTDAEATAARVGELAGVATSDVLVCSTGLIGERLDMDRLLAGLPDVIADAARDDDGAGAERAARAIITTDTHPKQVAYEVRDHHGSCRIGAMAKGAAMIEPTMATMLAVITTDAPLSAAVCRQLLRRAVATTFNRISVDASGSTNDTVIALASGTASEPPGPDTLQRAFEAVCADLARAIVEDGEGTTRIGAITVTGAERVEDAEVLARSIVRSVLFRAALHGADPNWGRILSAMGLTDVPFEPARVSVTIGDVQVCRFGTATTFDRGRAAAAMERDWVDIVVDLGAGRSSATFLTADLTPDYVAMNAYYTT